MKWLIIALALVAVIIGYSYITVSNGPIEPLGRLAFVKTMNPDFYPGHTHSKLLAQYAEERNSKTALVVHMAGGSNYRSYPEGDVYLIEVAFIDTQGIGSASLNQIDLLDSLKVALFGVPDGRYKYMSDGKIYNTYDEMMNHVNQLAKEHGQKGPIPMVWHGNARTDNPVLVQGDGFPLYFQILTKEYGVVPAYTYMIYGMIYPYIYNPYRNFELQHASELQTYYNEGLLNHDYKQANTNTSEYYKGNQNKEFE
ncbi:MAG: hypothetical protein ACPK7O_00490 [Methanobacterium sp.]